MAESVTGKTVKFNDSPKLLAFLQFVNRTKLIMPLTAFQFFREFKFELNFVLENSKVVKIVTIVPSVFNCLCKLQLLNGVITEYT